MPTERRRYRSSQRAWSTSPRVATCESHSTSLVAGSSMSTDAKAALFRSSARSSRKEPNRRTRAPDSALQDGQREAAAGDGRLRQPDALAHLALLQQEIAQPDTMQYVVDATLKQHP